MAIDWKNKDEVREYKRQYSLRYYQKNKVERKEYQRQRYHEQPEVCKAAATTYAIENPDKTKGYKRTYRLANLGKLNAAWHKRKAIIRGNGGTHTVEQWQQKLVMYGSRCAYCGIIDKMTKDHVTAIANGGTNDITNIVPACLTCNSSKGSRVVNFRVRTL